ncbi:hypothetical protein Q1695_011500 [Nippostrongylus brasiliensis]|nr:hypothetical protein Q1695_011500 [Nippostrongylus brasiliensis]
MPTINPYQHTSFVRDPKHGRRLYMDDVHDDLVGVPNVFTTTPTINKYRRSTDSTREILNIPSLTVNKRMLTTDSIYEIEGIPCPFTKRKGPEPNSAYDYTPYGQHVRYGPMHSDYDYTAYAQPPPYHYYPPYFAPAPLPMSPYGYHHCWCYQSGPHHSPFMGGAHTPHSYGHSVCYQLLCLCVSCTQSF